MAQYEMDVPAPNLWKLIFFDTLFRLFFWVCSIHPQMGSENTVSQNLLVLIHPQIPSQPPSRPAAQPPSLVPVGPEGHLRQLVQRLPTRLTGPQVCDGLLGGRDAASGAEQPHAFS